MPNIRIPFEPGRIYHIYNHANGKEKIFLHDENYRFFIQQYLKYIPQVAETFVYCLLPQHFHLLVRIKEDIDFTNLAAVAKPSGFRKNPEGLSRQAGFASQEIFSKHISHQFGSWLNSYTKSFNKLNNRKGTLFYPNFKRKLVTDDVYLKNLVLYIHQNPQHHNYVDGTSDWPHSSYITFLSNGESFVRKDEVIGWFGDFENFKYCHEHLGKFIE